MSRPAAIRATMPEAVLSDALVREGWLHPDSPLARALAPLLSALKWKGVPRQLVDALPGRFAMLDLEGLRGVMAQLGFASQARRQRLDRIGVAALPCLFVSLAASPQIYVLLKRGKDGFLAHDAASGKLVIVPPQRLSGTCVRFDALADEAPAGKASWFIGALRRFHRTFRDVLWLGLAVNTFALVVPFFTMLVYDRVIGAASPVTLLYLLGAALFALVAEIFFRIARGALLSHFGARLNHLVACTIFNRFLALEPMLGEQMPPSSQIARVKTFEAVREFFTGQNFILFIELPFILVVLGVLLLLAPGMAAVCAGASIAFALLTIAQIRNLRDAAQKAARSGAERQAASLEIFTKIEALHVNGFASALLKRFDEANRRAARDAAELSYAMHVMEHLAAAFIIDDILDLSKVESGRLELEEVPFDLNSTAEDAVEMLAVI